jgi:hypothetical protein
MLGGSLVTMTWLEKGFSKLLDQMKHAKLQWSQYPNHISGDNLNNIRCEASRHFGNKMKEYFKDKISELQIRERTRTLTTCIVEQINLKGATNLEVAY